MCSTRPRSSLILRLVIPVLLVLMGTQAVAAGKLFELHCEQPFPEAVVHLQSAINQAGYTIAKVQHVDKGLLASGYKTDKYWLVFFGKKEDINWIRANMPELLALLPLHFIAYEEGDGAVIFTLDPVAFADLYPGRELQPIFLRWSADVESIMASASACTE